MKAIVVGNRQVFERLRFCPNCGQRLRHLQWDSDTHHIFEKKCGKLVSLNQPDLKHHFWFVHSEEIIRRSSRGRLTNGAKKALRDK